MGGAMTGIWTLTWFDFEQFFSILFFQNVLEKPVALERVMATITYRVSEKTWEFSDEFDIVFLNNSLI